MRVAFVFLILASCSISAGSQLHWVQRSAELRPKPDEAQVVATFPFTNAGSEPVTITSLRTSCDCTTASLAKHTYAPGEGGSITATFTVGGRTGPQTKTILVRTTDRGGMRFRPCCSCRSWHAPISPCPLS